MTTPPTSSGPEAVCILGMHRSGTSCLAGILQQGGLHLGEARTRSTWNPRGNGESRKIMQLQEELLRDSGGRWDDPPERVRWRRRHRRMRDQFIEAHRQMTPWGFKDPRTVFTIEGWLEAVPDLRLVGTFRHPVPVARSLQRRGGRELGGWIDLWYLYNERLLKLRDRHSFDLVNFDPALRSDDEVESGEVTLPPAAAALYEELLARSM